MWNKELEAAKILKKEKEQHRLFHTHRDGRSPEPYTKIGYCKEGVMQSDFFAWALNSYIEELSLCLFHIPNEGDTAGEAGAIKGGIRKALGVVAGAPDFCLVLRSDLIIFIELKLPGETLSQAQIKLHEKWKKRGIIIHMVSTFVAWREIIEKALLSLNFDRKSN